MNDNKKKTARTVAGIGSGLAIGALAIGAVVGLSGPANAADVQPGSSESTTAASTGLAGDVIAPNGPATISVQLGDDGSISVMSSTSDVAESTQAASTGLSESAPGLPETTAVSGNGTTSDVTVPTSAQ